MDADKWSQNYSTLNLGRNPFIPHQFHKLPEYFVDRNKLIRNIHQKAESIIKDPRVEILILCGEVGFGKSSILYEVKEEFSRKIFKTTEGNEYRPLAVKTRIRGTKMTSRALFMKGMLFDISKAIDRMHKEKEARKNIITKCIERLRIDFRKKMNQEIEDFEENAQKKDKYGVKFSIAKFFEIYYETNIEKKLESPNQEKTIDFLLEVFKALILELRDECGIVFYLIDDGDILKTQKAYLIRELMMTEFHDLPIFFMITMRYFSTPEIMEPFEPSFIKELWEFADPENAAKLIEKRLNSSRIDLTANIFHPFTPQQIDKICELTYSIPLYIEYICSEILELACDKREEDISQETFDEGMKNGWKNILRTLTRRKRDIILEMKRIGKPTTPYELGHKLGIKRQTVLEYLKEMERSKLLKTKYLKLRREEVEKRGRDRYTEKIYYLIDEIDQIKLQDLENILQ